MKKNVMLLVRGTQAAPGEKPATIELTTEAIWERTGDEITLTYEESLLTGLGDTTTVFRISPGMIVLERTGAVEAAMVFVEGQSSESFYRIEDGALLLRIYAQKMQIHLEDCSGWFDLRYGIEVEGTPMGIIDYHIAVLG